MSFRLSSGPVFQRADPIDPPLVPGIYDDEFESTTLDPSWTRVGTFNDVDPIDPALGFASGGTRWSLHGAPAPTARRSWYMLQTETATVPQIQKLVTFPSECFVWSRMSFGYRNAGQANDDGTAHITLSDGGSLNALAIYLTETDANAVYARVLRAVAGVTTTIATMDNVGGAGLTIGQAAHTVGIQKIGTTYYFWLLTAAGNWMNMGSTTFAPTLTTAILRAYASSTAVPGNVIVGFDFFRFKDGRTLP